MTADIVIKGGTVVDGTDTPGYAADVAITAGRITDIGPNLSGARDLDATGQIVSPGFIDIHTHFDAQVFWDPALTPSSFHGVTSVIAGNCGFTIAPVFPDNVGLLARTLQHVEDMSLETLTAGVPWDEFETFPQYLDAVRRRGTVLNYGCYVGHTAVRIHAMGYESYERAATDDEIAAMQRLIADAMDGGAIGFATSASPTHNGDSGRPVPSRVADIAELRELMLPVRDAQRGVIAMLPGGVFSNQQMFDLQREIGRPFTWTALLTIKGLDYHVRVMEEHDRARAEGVDVWPQVSCRPLAFQMNLLEPFTFNMRAAFAELMDRPRDERAAAYRSPEWRARAWDDLNNTRVLPTNWGSMSVAESERHPELIGRSVRELAAERGVNELEAMLDIALDDNLETRFRSVLANNDPEAIAWLLPQRNALLGLADSGAHVGQLCDACFATDLLGNWVRDKKVMPLEQAIHKLSGEPASVYGLSDRGTIEVGKAADITVFDFETVAPGGLRRVRDFPANGERLTADQPVGMTHTLVNGVPIRVDGDPVPAALHARPGVILDGR
jgi:N-acyl-D-aspartate/D-glutamate deacylase